MNRCVAKIMLIKVSTVIVGVALGVAGLIAMGFALIFLAGVLLPGVKLTLELTLGWFLITTMVGVIILVLVGETHSCYLRVKEECKEREGGDTHGP